MHYKRICEIIKEADYVFGHSINGDAKALNDECLRYNLPSIDYKFYDIKLFFKEFKNYSKETSVLNILKDLGIAGEDKVHILFFIINLNLTLKQNLFGPQ